FFVAGLNALEVASRNEFDKRAGNHILVVTVCSFSQQSRISPATTEVAARTLANRYEKRLAKNCVNIMELRYVQRASRMAESCVPIRLVLDNPTGQTLRVRKFVEVTNPTTGEQVLSALDSGDTLSISSRDNGANYSSRISRGNDLDGRPVDYPHPLACPLDQKRAMASSLSTPYIPQKEYIRDEEEETEKEEEEKEEEEEAEKEEEEEEEKDLFEEAVKKQWRKCPKFYFRQLDEFPGGNSPDLSPHSTFTAATTRSYNAAPPASFLPDKVLEAVELSLNSKGMLEEIYREPGQNECGMVAWKVNIYTPEFPKGRPFILIGNDCTIQMGTFGVQEDLLFQKASEISRKQGIPRVYIAVNSGARMGLAAEVQKVLKVEWIDSQNPSRGFKYIYLTASDYKRLRTIDSVVAEPVDHPTEGKVYKITDVIGSQIGLGVENLCGSGAIAGETSKAYNSTFTITFVTGRSVGIGAYITRLGQRVIQKSSCAPILLTGYQALNRLNGRDVYTSNDEIGGIDVMYKNGVSHLVVKGDLEGCEAILDWLSYVPAHRDGPLPIMVDPNDPINRSVFYKPSRATDDPRFILTGCIDTKGQWLGGIFDRGTFREVLADWAKSVICGRARLGGIPVGVINVETRVTQAKQPADPAMPNTSEITFPRAGQVWFPDSAYKTAQSIWDFGREELPLFIFANWRGFSGGQRDMFNEVLKFGSFIVDALVAYKQPCFVYIPPKAELRGGAWVVVDSRINPEHMEMYADIDSRGGVLEPTGMVEIKYREKALVETATRLDPTLRQLTEEDKHFEKEGVPIDASKRQTLKEKYDKRLQELLPVYKQVAVYFADLHDTSVRMKKKHAIRDIVPWEKSRHFFYWRLRRQLILFNLRNEVIKCHPTLSLIAAERLIYKWAEDSGHSVESNYQFVQWACHSIQDISKRLKMLRRKYIRQQTIDLCKESAKTVIETVKEVEPTALLQHAAPPAIAHNSASSSQRSVVALSAITQPNEEQQ
ncbi:acetyl-CoA carboxylase ACC1, partial [Cardiosporidium cionae]